MEYLLKHPVFWAGVIAALVGKLVIESFLRVFRPSNSWNGATVESLVKKMKGGASIDLDKEFPPEGRKDKTTAGYRAWRTMAYWLAATYADYRYAGETVTDFWNLVRYCFGEGAAYSKMRALDEIINRSTKYYTKDGRPYDRIQDQDRTELYKMVGLITDSFAPEVYERERKDRNHNNG